MFTFDKSMRRIDADGHLHVERANISKANVCPYFGREIPDYQALGLDADRVYMMYRDPEELRKAASTFAGKPILLHHRPVHASDPTTIQKLAVGSIGTDVKFNFPYLDAPLSIWRGDAIEAIDSEEQRELSPGYRYTADMTPGRNPEGVAFDGSMRQIMGNHLALVFEGRTGRDVVVPDAMPKGSAMKFAKFFAAFAPLFPGVTAEQTVALDAALAEDLKPAAPVVPVVVLDEAKVRTAYEASAEFKAKYVALDSGIVTKVAHDEALAAASTAHKVELAAAVSAAVAANTDLHAARATVADKVGVTALDSAEATYRYALTKIGVEHKDVPAAGLPALYTAGVKPVVPTQALDAATGKIRITELFPSLSQTRRG